MLAARRGIPRGTQPTLSFHILSFSGPSYCLLSDVFSKQPVTRTRKGGGLPVYLDKPGRFYVRLLGVQGEKFDDAGPSDFCRDSRCDDYPGFRRAHHPTLDGRWRASTTQHQGAGPSLLPQVPKRHEEIERVLQQAVPLTEPRG